MGNYREEYDRYYQGIRNKVSTKDNTAISRGKGENNNSYTRYSTRANSYYGRDDYRRDYAITSKNTKEGSKYIKRLITRLTITGILFCGVLILRVSPINEAREFYMYCKNVIKSNFDYRGFLLEVDKLRVNIKDEINENIETFKNINTEQKDTLQKQDKEKRVNNI